MTATIFELCAVVLPGNDDQRVSVLYHAPLLLEAPSASEADEWVASLDEVIANPHMTLYNARASAGKRTSLVASSTTAGGGQSVGSSELATLSGLHEYEVAFAEEGPLGLGLETGPSFDVAVKGEAEGGNVRCRVCIHT